MRLSRIAALCPAVKRPAIDAPARCTTASTPDSRSGAGASGRHCRSSFVACRPPDQPDHPVPAGGQKRRERRPDQAGRARDRDDHRLRARRRGVAVGGQVVGELAMPVDERGPQRRTGHRGVDLVAHAGATAGRIGELVGVPPPADDAGRQGSRPRRRQHVDEAVRRVEAVPIVLGDPAQPARQAEHRLAVGQRFGLGHHRHRLPRRNEPGHRARPGVPGEHLGQRMVDDAFVLDAHGPFP